jgi:hypothetical protein
MPHLSEPYCDAASGTDLEKDTCAALYFSFALLVSRLRHSPNPLINLPGHHPQKRKRSDLPY